MDTLIRCYRDADAGRVVALWEAVLPDSAPHNEPAIALRKKLEADPQKPRYLLTEPGAGYRLVNPVLSRP